MTAGEFRKILDRFHMALAIADQWAIDTNYRDAPKPEWVGVLDQVWRDLNRECALMKDAEHAQRRSLDERLKQWRESTLASQREYAEKARMATMDPTP